MKRTVTFRDFCDAFRRLELTGNFDDDNSNLETLFDLLEEEEEQTGVQTDLDVRSICVSFSCLSLIGVSIEFGEEFEDSDECLEWLQERTEARYNTGTEKFIFRRF